MKNQRKTKHAAEASKNGFGKYCLGAAIYNKKGKLISSGFNKCKTHTKFGSGYHNRIHAEGDALIKALKSGQDFSEGYCVVYRNKGNLAKPCACCEELLKAHKIKKVFYTTGNGNLKEMEL